jgi:hypothetical protein
MVVQMADLNSCQINEKLFDHAVELSLAHLVFGNVLMTVIFE